MRSQKIKIWKQLKPMFATALVPVVILSLFFLNDLFSKPVEQPQVEPTNSESSPLPLVINSPSPDLVVKKTGTPIKQADPNRPVHCEIAPECGGGTIPLTFTECENSTCCQLKDGNKFMSTAECDKIHGQYDSENNALKEKANRPPVVLGGYTYYCDESATGALKDAVSNYQADYKVQLEQCSPSSQTGYCDSAKQAAESSYATYKSLIDRYCN